MAYLLGFNNNIRCIEMYIPNLDRPVPVPFNNNIRCIEITLHVARGNPYPRLITT